MAVAGSFAALRAYPGAVLPLRCPGEGAWPWTLSQISHRVLTRPRTARPRVPGRRRSTRHAFYRIVDAVYVLSNFRQLFGRKFSPFKNSAFIRHLPHHMSLGGIGN